MSTKTIIFIRHGESTENVKTAHVLAGVKRLKEFKLPRYKMFTSGLKLLEFQLNAPLSDLGIRQVRDMSLILKSADFWRDFNPDVVVYSSLQRAKHTLLGIYPPRTDSDTTSNKYDPFVASLYTPDKLQEMECLREATPMEHIPIFTKGLKKRMREFENFLQTTPHSKIVVCGHSQYFKQLLKLPNLMRNVDVWQATYRLDDDVWSFHNVHLLYRTELSKAHVFDKIVGVEPPGSDSASDTSASDNDGDGTPNGDENEGGGGDDHGNVDIINDSRTDGEDGVKTCRICTCSNEDLPDKAHTLIQPCACRGSQAYVHTACLNRWRATSDAARDICSVCKFRYRVRRNEMANFLMSPSGVLVITAALLLLLILVTGALFYEGTKYLREHSNNPFIALWYSSQYLLSHDVLALFYDPAAFIIQTLRFPKTYLWWRECRPTTYNIYLDNWNFLWGLHQNKQHDIRSTLELTVMDYVAHSMYLLTGMLQNSTVGCNGATFWMMETTVCGVGLVATYGLGEYIITVLMNHINMNNLEESLQRLFPAALTVMSIYGSPIFGRFVGLVGLGWSIREVYCHMKLYGTQLATNLGETILERDATTTPVA